MEFAHGEPIGGTGTLWPLPLSALPRWRTDRSAMKRGARFPTRGFGLKYRLHKCRFDMSFVRLEGRASEFRGVRQILGSRGAMPNMRRVAEWILAIVAASVCFAAARVFSRQDDLLPLPGLYLIEIVLAGGLGLTAVAKSRTDVPGWSLIPWVAAGVLLAFVILGAWTIGLFIAPAAVALFLAGYLADLRLGRRVAPHVAAFLGAAMVQASIVWVVFTSS
jgi:hypothetical protein